MLPIAKLLWPLLVLLLARHIFMVLSVNVSVTTFLIFKDSDTVYFVVVQMPDAVLSYLAAPAQDFTCCLCFAYSVL